MQHDDAVEIYGYDYQFKVIYTKYVFNFDQISSYIHILKSHAKGIVPTGINFLYPTQKINTIIEQFNHLTIADFNSKENCKCLYLIMKYLLMKFTQPIECQCQSNLTLGVKDLIINIKTLTIEDFFNPANHQQLELLKDLINFYSFLMEFEKLNGTTKYIDKIVLDVGYLSIKDLSNPDNKIYFKLMHDFLSKKQNFYDFSCETSNEMKLLLNDLSKLTLMDFFNNNNQQQIEHLIKLLKKLI